MSDKKNPFDSKTFKKGISAVESSGGKNLWNTTSSATGTYQFLYNEIKDLPQMKGITREQFKDNFELQEQIMDLAIEGKLKNRAGYYRNANDLTADYQDLYGDKWNYRADEVAAMTHFLGRQGARNFLKAEATGGEFKVPGQNLEVGEYLNKYNKAIGSSRGIPKMAKNTLSKIKSNERLKIGNERLKGIQKPDNLAISNFTRPVPKAIKPQQQQVKPQAQQTSTDFLIAYVNNNEFANGGKQETMNNPNDILNEFNAGGSHEQNPLGGIPQGTGANGQMNTVEQGETKKEDYVFSDRLTIDDTIIKRHSLPKNLKGKTFAEASKQLNQQNKESVNDNVSKETSQEMLARLENASEEVRLAHEMLDGELGNQNQAFLGGQQHAAPEAGTSAAGGFGIGTGIAQAGMGLFNAGQEAFGKTGVDTSGVERQANVDMAGGALKGAMTGASAGMALGPIGAAAGAIIGGGASLIGGSKKQKAIEEGNKNNDYIMNNKHSQQFAFGGYTDPINPSTGKNQKSIDQQTNAMNGINQPNLNLGRYKDYFDVKNQGVNYVVSPNNLNPQNAQGFNKQLKYIQGLNPNARLDGQYQQFQNRNAYGGKQNQYPNGGRPEVKGVNSLTPEGYSFLDPFGGREQQTSVGSVTPEGYQTQSIQGQGVPYGQSQGQSNQTQTQDNGFMGKIGEFGSNAMRYAPTAMNAFQLGTMGKPDVESLDRIGNRYQKQNVDEKQLQNIASNSYGNAANALKGATNGSVGSLRNNLLGAHLNKQKGLSAAYMQAENVNRGENKTEQQFNLNVDKTNLGQSNRENEINARNKGQHLTNKSRLLSALGNDVGNIGLEQLRKKYPERLGLLYDYLGKFQA